MKGVRRKEKEITDQEQMIGILNEARYVTLAMGDSDGPYLVTLTHVYDRERNAVYFHCAPEGRKLDILRKDNRVWGQALIDKGYVEGKCDHLYVTTQFKGTVRFVDDSSEKRRALEAMIKKNDRSPEKVISRQLTEKSVRDVTIGRVDIQLMTGKRSDKVVVSL